MQDYLVFMMSDFNSEYVAYLNLYYDNFLLLTGMIWAPETTRVVFAVVIF